MFPDPPPLPAPCLADVSGDQIVGITDFLAVLGTWGPCPAPCATDFTGPGGLPDGMVGIDDFLAVLGSWGACP